MKQKQINAQTKKNKKQKSVPEKHSEAEKFAAGRMRACKQVVKNHAGPSLLGSSRPSFYHSPDDGEEDAGYANIIEAPEVRT